MTPAMKNKQKREEDEKALSHCQKLWLFLLNHKKLAVRQYDIIFKATELKLHEIFYMHLFLGGQVRN